MTTLAHKGATRDTFAELQPEEKGMNQHERFLTGSATLLLSGALAVAPALAADPMSKRHPATAMRHATCDNRRGQHDGRHEYRRTAHQSR